MTDRRTAGRLIAMRGRGTLAVAALLALSLLGASKLAPSPPAEAAPSAAKGTPTGQCSGVLIERAWTKTRISGRITKLGHLDVFYDRETGKNCARMNHYGPTYGRGMWTKVQLRICSNREPGRTCRNPTKGVQDDGVYSYYAGPVTTKQSAAGRCIEARGYLTMPWRDSTLTIETVTRPPVGHCG